MLGVTFYFLVILGFASSIRASTAVLGNPPVLSFEEGYTELFGDRNVMILRDGRTVHLSLDERTGAGFVSQDLYLHGFFSASIKLPADYTAGVVVAFYDWLLLQMSNGDIFETTHDELDFEFLGNVRGKEWRIQTNVYGNGSTGIGREERYGLWFDPAEDFHHYSILWTDYQIIFYVDNIPIREIKRTEAMGGVFPSKPMSLYATIWDGSTWATSGGRYKVNYKYAPFIAEFSDLVLRGCAVDPIEQSSRQCDDGHEDLSRLSETGALIMLDQQSMMTEFRMKHMTYSYCYDRVRYPTPLPECAIDLRKAGRLRESSWVKFGGVHGLHGKRRRHRSSSRGTTLLS
ncbi:putative xyloglucan endotransglucosylase/hydrolase protein 27 [Asimina triloba]